MMTKGSLHIQKEHENQLLGDPAGERAAASRPCLRVARNIWLAIGR